MNVIFLYVRHNYLSVVRKTYFNRKTIFKELMSNTIKATEATSYISFN